MENIKKIGKKVLTIVMTIIVIFVVVLPGVLIGINTYECSDDYFVCVLWMFLAGLTFWVVIGFVLFIIGLIVFCVYHVVTNFWDSYCFNQSRYDSVV